LELIAAFNAIKCFATSASYTSIEISIDNTTAVSYINRQVGLRSGALCETALEIYSWCEARTIDLHAIYLRGSSNLVGVAESPTPVAAGDWKLSTSAFQKIHQAWKSEVDLFASAWNAQLPIFVSRFPQPGAWMTDVFTLNWKSLKAFAFPPFDLILILAEPTLVSGFAETGDGHPMHATPGERSADIPAGSMSPAHSQLFIPTSHLEAIGGMPQKPRVSG
jgi:hypothetical protein